MSEFVIPNLGDGVAAGDVLRVLVKAGDTVTIDQAVLELETDKATVEVPIDVAGTIKEVRVKPGDKVKPGQAVLTIDNGGSSQVATNEPANEQAPKTEATAAAKPEPQQPSPAAERPDEHEKKRAPVV